MLRFSKVITCHWCFDFQIYYNKLMKNRTITWRTAKNPQKHGNSRLFDDWTIDWLTIIFSPKKTVRIAPSSPPESRNWRETGEAEESHVPAWGRFFRGSRRRGTRWGHVEGGELRWTTKRENWTSQRHPVGAAEQSKCLVADATDCRDPAIATLVERLRCRVIWKCATNFRASDNTIIYLYQTKKLSLRMVWKEFRLKWNCNFLFILTFFLYCCQ